MLIRKLAFAAFLASFALPAHADGDAASGEKVFKKCKACHDIGEGAKDKVGPALTGVAGAELASSGTFKYSDAFLARKAEGVIWTDDELNAFLTKPKEHIPGTKMTFAGLKKPEDRANVIAYLKSF